IGLGKIIIAPKEHKNIKMDVEFKELIRLREYRKVRKILELTDEETSIIAYPAFILKHLFRLVYMKTELCFGVLEHFQNLLSPRIQKQNMLQLHEIQELQMSFLKLVLLKLGAGVQLK